MGSPFLNFLPMFSVPCSHAGALSNAVRFEILDNLREDGGEGEEGFSFHFLLFFEATQHTRPK